MAKDQDLDDFDMDDELDLPGFDDGDITPPEDNRKPIVRAAGGFLNGVKDTALNTGFQRKMIGEALPTGYGKAFDDLQEAASVGRELYDTALENLRPVQRDLKKIGRRLSGKLDGVLPKGIAEKIKSWSEDDDTASTAEVDWKEAEITSQIGEIFGNHFGTQMQMQAEFEERRQEQEAVKTAVEDAKYENQANLLTVIRSGMDRLVAYQDKITAGYQRKMLELQYRQYFLARDQYTVFEAYVKETKTQLDDIRKNTGLPDFVKINTSEMARQQMMERLIGSVRDRAGDFAKNFGRRVKDRMVTQVKGLSQQVVDGVRGVNDALEQTEGAPVDGADMAGSMLAGGLMDRFGGKAARKLGEYLGKNERVKRYGNLMEFASDNKGELFRNVIAQQRNRDIREGPLGLLDKAIAGLAEFGSQYSQDFNPTDVYGIDPTKMAEQGAPYTQLTDKSITEVIPGLLTEILRETEMIRTGGDNAERKIYDYESGTLKRQGEVEQKLLDKVFNKGTVEMIREDLNKVADEVIGDRKVSPEARVALIKQLMSMASQGRGFNPMVLAAPGGITSTKDWKVIDEVRNLIIDRYMGDGKLRTDDGEAMASVNRASARFISVRDAIPNHQEAVRRLMPVYGAERLQRAGLITADADLTDEELKTTTARMIEIREKLKNARLPYKERETLQKEMTKLQAKLQTGQSRTNLGGINDYLATGADPTKQEVFDRDLKTRQFGSGPSTASDTSTPPPPVDTGGFSDVVASLLDKMTQLGQQFDASLKGLGDRLDPHAKLDLTNDWLEKIHNLLTKFQGPQGPGGGGGGGGGGDGGGPTGPGGGGGHDFRNSRWLKGLQEHAQQFQNSRWAMHAKGKINGLKDRGMDAFGKLKNFDFNDAKDSALLHAMYGYEGAQKFLADPEKFANLKGKAAGFAQGKLTQLKEFDNGRSKEALETLRSRYEGLLDQLPDLKGAALAKSKEKFDVLKTGAKSQYDELLKHLPELKDKAAGFAQDKLNQLKEYDGGRSKDALAFMRSKYDDLASQFPELKDKFKDLTEEQLYKLDRQLRLGMQKGRKLKDEVLGFGKEKFDVLKTDAKSRYDDLIARLPEMKDNVIGFGEEQFGKLTDFKDTALIHGMYGMDKLQAGKQSAEEWIARMKDEVLPEGMDDIRKQVMEVYEKHIAQRSELETLSKVMGGVKDQALALTGSFKDKVGKVDIKADNVINLKAFKDQIEAKREQLSGMTDQVYGQFQKVVGGDFAFPEFNLPNGLSNPLADLDLSKLKNLKMSTDLFRGKDAVNDPSVKGNFLDTLKGTVKDVLDEQLPKAKGRFTDLKQLATDKLQAGKEGLAGKLDAFSVKKDQVLNTLTELVQGKGSKDEGTVLGGDDYWTKAKELMQELFAHMDAKAELVASAIYETAAGDGEGGADGKPGFWSRTGRGLGSGLGAAAKGIGKFYGGVWKAAGKITGGLGGGIGAIAKGVGSGLGGLLQNKAAPSDLYLKGEKQPIILLRDLKAGKYLDFDTGEVITKVTDIKGPLVDDTGNIVLSREDLQSGRVVNVHGKNPFQGASGVIAMLGKGAGAYLKGVGKFYGAMGKGAMGVLGLAKDLVLGDGSPRDIYVQGETKPRLLAFKLKHGGYYSKETGNPITSIKDIDGDVIDEEGNVILSTDDAAKGLVDSRGRKVRSMMGLAGKVLGGAWKGYKAYLGALGKIGKGALNMLSGKFSFGGGDETSTALLEETKKQTGLLEEIKKGLTSGNKRTAGDADGDGVRDGSWMSKLGKNGRDIVKDDRKHEFKDRTKDSLLNQDDEGGGLLDKAMDFVGMGDGDDRGGRGRKRGRGKGGRFMRGLKTAGRGLGTLARGGLMLGKGALALGKGALVLGKGAAMLAGGLLSAPVLLTAAAVTAVGVVGYMAYKHLYKKPKGPIHAVRLVQYGFSPDNKDALSRVAALEKIVEPEAKVGDGNSASFSGKLDPTKLLEAVGINKDDEGAAAKFAEWFKGRFSPVFLSHVAVAKRMAGGASLMDLDDKLDASGKLEYLKAVAFPIDGDSPYNFGISPFEGIDKLITGSEVKGIIDGYIAKLVKEGGVAKESNEPPKPEASVDVNKPVSTAQALAAMAPPSSGSEATGPTVPEVKDLSTALSTMADGTSPELTEGARAKRERTLTQVQQQTANASGELVDRMARVEDVLQRSYTVQVSMDKSLREIWGYLKDKRDAEAEEAGWSLFGGSEKKPQRPASAPTTPRKPDRPVPPPAVDMKRS